MAASRQRTLLAALLVRPNRTVPVDELAELVWDASPPGGAARTVRSYAVRLRRAVGPAVAARIVTKDPGYRCEVTEDELDVLRFEALCRQGGAAARARAWRQARGLLAEALSLWRGTPLDDIASQTLRQECTEQLEQARLQAIEWRNEADLHLGRHQELIPELRALAGEYPLREHGQAQLMLALYRCGRAAEALQAFQQARQVLVRELGIEPGPELRALQEKILAGDAGLAASPPGGELTTAVRHAPAGIPRPLPPAGKVPRELPPTAPGFTGRSSELAALTRLLDRPDALAPGAVVVSAIGGTGGVGKTALAVHWAHGVAERFPDGQLFVNLRGFDPAGTPLQAGTVVRRFLEALAVPPERIPADLDAQVGLYRSVLAGKRMLIVLDNARDSSQVRPLLPGTRGCLVLVTSRSRLTDLVAVDGAVPVPVGPLTQAEARELLARRLGADRIAGRPEAVDELIELCARLPLALNIASARPAASLEMLLDDLRDERRRLDMLSAGPGPADIRAVLSWSFSALSTPAARLLCLLSLHPGPDISLPAAAAVAALTADDTHRTVRELLDAYLLAEHARHRYSMHDLLRVYAAEQASRRLAGGEQDQAAGRMLDYYLHTVHAAARIIKPARGPLPLPVLRDAVTPEQFADHQQAGAWCHDEQAVLAAVTRHAARDGHHTHAWQLACSTVTALESTGHWQHHLALLRIGLHAAEHAGDPSGQAHARRQRGRALMMGGRPGPGLDQLQQAMNLFGQLGDVLNQAETHLALSVALARLDQPAQALSHTQHALGLYQDADNIPGQAHALGNMCWFQAILGQHEQALISAGRALHLAPQTGHPFWQAAVLDTIGYIHHQQGDQATAVRHYQEALSHNKSGDLNPRVHAGILAHLSDAYSAAGDHTNAQTTRNQSAAILGRLQHPTPPDTTNDRMASSRRP